MLFPIGSNSPVGCPPQPALYIEQSQKAEANMSPSGTIGTMEVGDWMAWGTNPCIPRYTARITKSETRIGMYFTGYVSSQTSECAADTTAYPTDTAPTALHWDAILDGTITHRTTGALPPVVTPMAEQVDLQIWYDGEVTDLAQMGSYAAHAGHVKNVRAQFSRPLRADMNKDGVVDSTDYGILSGEWLNSSSQCSCPQYWWQ